MVEFWEGVDQSMFFVQVHSGVASSWTGREESAGLSPGYEGRQGMVPRCADAQMSTGDEQSSARMTRKAGGGGKSASEFSNATGTRRKLPNCSRGRCVTPSLTLTYSDPAEPGRVRQNWIATERRFYFPYWRGNMRTAA